MFGWVVVQSDRLRNGSLSLYLFHHASIIHSWFSICKALKQLRWDGAYKFCRGFLFLYLTHRYIDTFSFWFELFKWSAYRFGFSLPKHNKTKHGRKNAYRNRHFDMKTDYRMKWHIHDNSEKGRHFWKHTENETANAEKNAEFRWIYVLLEIPMCLINHIHHEPGPNKHLRNHFK